MSVENIKAKIEKLLSLASSSNENEAALAMEKANQLMLLHNIQEFDVKSKEKPYIMKDIGESYHRESAEQKYIKSLVDKYFFVKVVTIAGKSAGETIYGSQRNSYARKVQFWGTEENIENAIYIYNFLTTSFKSLWADFKKTNGLDDTKRQSFYIGLHKGLKERLDLSKKSFESEYGLVVVPDAGLEKFLRDGGARTKSQSRANYNVEADTINAGKEQSSKISLSKGINYKENSTKLIG